jgi:hemerythrin-like domain-containing protein
LGAEHETERALAESGMAVQVERLERLDIQSPSFVTQFQLFEEALSRHNMLEEQEQLPRVLETVDDDQARMVVRVLAAEEAAASRRSGHFSQMLASARVHVRALAAQG